MHEDPRSRGADDLPHGPVQDAGAPQGAVTRPAAPLPVLATIYWLDGHTLDLPAIAVAWTRKTVEVVWEEPSFGLTRTWLPAGDVRRGQAAADRIKQVRET